jgi:hypothetical protein
MKKVYFIFAACMLLISVSCNKEEGIKPSADFSTDIQNNTLAIGQGFTVFLDNVQGEFLVYFRGLTEATTYSPTDGRRQGTPISNDLKELAIPGYAAAGQYVFTLVASSSGNWAENYMQDVKSITITVN